MTNQPPKIWILRDSLLPTKTSLTRNSTLVVHCLPLICTIKCLTCLLNVFSDILGNNKNASQISGLDEETFLCKPPQLPKQMQTQWRRDLSPEACYERNSTENALIPLLGQLRISNKHAHVLWWLVANCPAICTSLILDLRVLKPSSEAARRSPRTMAQRLSCENHAGTNKINFETFSPPKINRPHLDNSVWAEQLWSESLCLLPRIPVTRLICSRAQQRSTR